MCLWLKRIMRIAGFPSKLSVCLDWDFLSLYRVIFDVFSIVPLLRLPSPFLFPLFPFYPQFLASWLRGNRMNRATLGFYRVLWVLIGYYGSRWLVFNRGSAKLSNVAVFFSSFLLSGPRLLDFYRIFINMEPVYIVMERRLPSALPLFVTTRFFLPSFACGCCLGCARQSSSPQLPGFYRVFFSQARSIQCRWRNSSRGTPPLVGYRVFTGFSFSRVPSSPLDAECLPSSQPSCRSLLFWTFHPLLLPHPPFRSASTDFTGFLLGFPGVGTLARLFVVLFHGVIGFWFYIYFYGPIRSRRALMSSTKLSTIGVLFFTVLPVFFSCFFSCEKSFNQIRLYFRIVALHIYPAVPNLINCSSF